MSLLRNIRKKIPKQLKQPIRDKITEYRNYKRRQERKKHARELIKKAEVTKESSKHDLEHILFIVIDCARRDHLSVYGYKRETTPFLKTLKGKAKFFNNAIAPSTWTYPSVASILSGLYPHNHGGVFSSELRNPKKREMPRKLHEDVLLLPEILEYFGYSTYMNTAIVTAALPILGGFQEIKGSHLKTSEKVISEYSSWLQSQKGKTFSYLQLGDLHQPVQVPDDVRSVFGEIPEIPHLADWDYLEEPAPGDPQFEHYREMRTKLYDASLRNIDRQIEMLFYKLDKMGILEDTLVVITADHGEELWDHTVMEQENFYDPRPAYGAGHGHHLWEEVIGVPLMVYYDGLTPDNIRERVSLIDMFPTLLEQLGIKGMNSLGLDGENLLENNQDRIVVSEDVSFGYEKKVVYKDNFKLYKSQGDNIHWTFDLVNDPQEQKPFSSPEIEKEMSLYLPSFSGGGERESIQVDKEVKKRLKELGYIE